jgi:hypothetical protein
MAKSKIDKTREHRIEMEIIVDAYDETERAMGWYYYLENEIIFPFTARCIAKRSISPLRVGDEVEVNGMAEEKECECEMFVTIKWEKERLAVPLSQLKPISSTDSQTRQAVEDWHYWVRQGYHF